MIQHLGWVQAKRGVIEDWKFFMESETMEVAPLEKMLISQGSEQARSFRNVRHPKRFCVGALGEWCVVDPFNMVSYMV